MGEKAHEDSGVVDVSSGSVKNAKFEKNQITYKVRINI